METLATVMGNFKYFFLKLVVDTWKEMKRGAGEGWRRSVGCIV
jgi:hypothetical protein